MRPLIYIGLVLILSVSCRKEEEKPDPGILQLVSVKVGPNELVAGDLNTGMPLDLPVVARFSQQLDTASVNGNFSISTSDGTDVPLDIAFLDGGKTISGSPVQGLDQKSAYTVSISNLIRGKKAETFPGYSVGFRTLNPPLEIRELDIDGNKPVSGMRMTGIDFRPVVTVKFSEPVDKAGLLPYTSFALGSLDYSYIASQKDDSTVSFAVSEDLPHYRKIRFEIGTGLGDELEKEFEGLAQEFYTKLDSTPKFPLVSDEELLTLVQRQTFKYFWDFAHPVSGLNRERNTSTENVTSGGSGFGVMCIPVGIERGFITRQEGVDRLEKIVHFLGGKAERFHGAWSHWLNGTTGKANPFSPKDNGGDLVETSYMAMGLITVRQYLDEGTVQEKALIDSINVILDGIEWDWYTQGNNSLTWHWSPDYGFEKNHIIRGWNEALITYIMAASSSTHGISKEVYDQGWAAGSNMINGKSFYGITLPLGRDYGGPLFFEQYTYLGVDPRNLKDQYADYWVQAVNHTLINRRHCIENPYNWVGYSVDCWGLTASDGNNGYSAHHPKNDRGVITPTAALSSIPFTPERSMEAMRHFYYMLGDRLWGPYGFYDAFNVTAGWFTTSNIAIDQGPILLMIENYRTQLLWDLFMSASEVQAALTKLGFTYQ